MTHAEFDRTKWRANMWAVIDQGIYKITGVDFEARKIEVCGHDNWRDCTDLRLATDKEIANPASVFNNWLDAQPGINTEISAE